MLFAEYKKIVENIALEDYSGLLNVGRKWKKIDDKQENAKIAFIGSASLQLITSVTRAMLTKYGVCADVYEGEYNGIIMDVYDENSDMYAFKPEYIVIIPDFHDIENEMPSVISSVTEVSDVVNNIVNRYNDMYDAIHKKLPGTQVIMCNIVEPYYDSLGNLAVNYISSQKMIYKQVNIRLVESRPKYVSIVDVEGLAAYVGKGNWFDESSYFLNKSGFALQYIGYFCDLIARQFRAYMGNPRKCIVLDLDNTLWGGVVGDQGYLGITIDPNDAEGEAYQAFQRYLLQLKDRGILLAVCSKNDEDNAREPFEKNPHMLLKLEDISAFVANWNDKASNIRLIANELNIGVDSFVFFDDNPTERELVREFLPEVMVIDVPEDPALYVRALDQSYAFEWSQITKEDINRSQTYSENRNRNKLMEACVNYDDYLEKLQMHILFEKLSDENVERFVQLTNKSNQFNLRTQRYSEAEIESMRNSNEYELYTVSLSDKFTNYGIVACIVINIVKDTYIIENWVMSCRVLKKTVEHYTIQRIVDIARERGCKNIKTEYIPSKKNGMVSELYDGFGFELINEENGIKNYILEEKMKSFKQKYYFMED